MKRYKFYVTLLDSFQWYLKSEQEEAFQDFIDKLNRVPFTSEAAAMGTAFNELIDEKTTDAVIITDNEIGYKGFYFDKTIVEQFKGYLKPAIKQVYVSANLEVSGAIVELYGYMDAVFMYKGYDVKTTARYEFPKFINGWQHRAYPYICNKSGIVMTEFEYTVTDFKFIYKECYSYQEKYEAELRGICSDLIAFIEEHRELITDKKLFSND